jgi:hypothetical protein
MAVRSVSKNEVAGRGETPFMGTPMIEKKVFLCGGIKMTCRLITRQIPKVEEGIDKVRNRCVLGLKVC